jgi:hypothetical protein
MDWALFQEFFFVFYSPVLAVVTEGFVAASMIVGLSIIVRAMTSGIERG